ncbi:hypothetical protein HPB50_014676 [Hyalomma asiaticum]|uniref:Uncharacterized protein n=1 Tax=Hyalomma asiaticum TaxID=266040 RepID=A0ACB7SCS8_HYAAI|nr:hypothetical protein HPB50_014676 [Hyalomma asiaticum]
MGAFSSNAVVDVAGFDAVASARAVSTRRAGGVDVYLKRHAPFSPQLRQQLQPLLILSSSSSSSRQRSTPHDDHDDDDHFRFSGKDGEYCVVILVGNVYGDATEHAASTDDGANDDNYAVGANDGVGVTVMTIYLAPNLARMLVTEHVDRAMDSVVAAFAEEMALISRSRGRGPGGEVREINIVQRIGAAEKEERLSDGK